MFDGMFGVIISIIIAVVFSKVSTQFDHIPLYVSGTMLLHLLDFDIQTSQWFTMVLYGYTSILFAYCVSLLSSSELAAFAIVAAWQVVMFMSVRIEPAEAIYNNFTGCTSQPTYLH